MVYADAYCTISKWNAEQNSPNEIHSFEYYIAEGAVDSKKW